MNVMRTIMYIVLLSSWSPEVTSAALSVRPVPLKLVIAEAPPYMKDFIGRSMSAKEEESAPFANIVNRFMRLLQLSDDLTVVVTGRHGEGLSSDITVGQAMRSALPGGQLNIKIMQIAAHGQAGGLMNPLERTLKECLKQNEELSMQVKMLQEQNRDLKREIETLQATLRAVGIGQ